MWVSFSNDVDIEVGVDPLLDDFGSNSVILLLLPSLSSCSRISTRSIYYILDLFFLEHGLSKIGPLRPILKAAELLSLPLAVVVFVHHFDDDLEEDEKCNTGAAERTPDLIA